MKYLMIFPMAFYVFYIWVLAVFNFYIRYRAIKSGEISHKYFQTYKDLQPSDRIQVVGRHYDNQFQLPILFLITCALSISFDLVTNMTLAFAWLFIISRLFHSWIHLGSNNVRLRVMAFATGWFLINLMWIQLLIQLTTFSVQ